jgi:hypothetical protein
MSYVIQETRCKGQRIISKASGLAVMTFDEIAARTGMSRTNVWAAYISGLRKIRRNPEIIARMIDNARALESERSRRQGAEVAS